MQNSLSPSRSLGFLPILLVLSVKCFGEDDLVCTNQVEGGK